MRRNGYTLLGWAVWHGGGWYLRRRARFRHTVRYGLVLAAGAAGGVLIARGARRTD